MPDLLETVAMELYSTDTGAVWADAALSTKNHYRLLAQSVLLVIGNYLKLLGAHQ